MSGRCGLSITKDILSYDRSPELSVHELLAIENFLRLGGDSPDIRLRPGTDQWTPDDLPRLGRLLKPILDVIDATDKNTCAATVARMRRRAVRVLLIEMRRRQSSLWAWTEADWVETLCGSCKSFVERYNVAYECRINVMSTAYILGGFTDLRKLGTYEIYRFACRVFDREQVDMSVGRVIDELKRWGYGTKENLKLVRTTVCEALIAVRSAYLEDVSLEVLAKLRKRTVNGMHASSYAHAISRVLVSLGILSEALPDDLYFNTPRKDVALIGVSPEWASWCKRWFSTSTLELASRKWSYYTILLAGRWLYQEHSEITSPEQWTRALAAEYVAAVDRVKIGQWCSGVNTNRTNIGKPLAPSTKDAYLRAMRIFFRDCKEWGWIQLKFDPTRALGTPSSITKLIRRDARVINDDIWAKMLCAGLNLTVEDLPKPGAACKKRGDVSYYPLEMMKAVVIVWLFGGLRNDEIRRLRVGCVEWQRDDMVAPDAGDAVSKDAICLLRVPACKFSPGFVKPVDRLVGEVIERWERTRTGNPLMLDPKTKENVNYLFSYRAKRIGRQFINRLMIPMLCRKAKVPEYDARGKITSHRARATIANQLSEFMSLVELMDWLGHTDPNAALHYIKTSMAKLSKTYKDSDYFGRNIRTAGITVGEHDLPIGSHLPADVPDAGAALTQLLAFRSTILRIGRNIVGTDEQRDALNALLLALDNLGQKVSLGSINTSAPS